jgi:hypothetical protein
VPRLISFPFRLDATGAVASVEQDTDPEVDEQIAIAMLTRPGERVTVPSFGVNDPAFDGFVLSALQRQCLDFGPKVSIKAVSTNRMTEGREQIVINWERGPEAYRGVPTP